MKLITVHLPDAYLTGIDKLVQEGVYPNRSEAIRMATRDLLRTELSGWVQYEPRERPNIF